MPQNFLEGCAAAEQLCDDIDELTPEQLDVAITHAGIDLDSEPQELKYLQSSTGIDSLGVIEGAEAADGCDVCSSLGQCMLGQFLTTKL